MQSERDQLEALQRQAARAAIVRPVAVAAPVAVTLPAAVADPRTQLKSMSCLSVSSSQVSGCGRGPGRRIPQISAASFDGP